MQEYQQIEPKQRLHLYLQYGRALELTARYDDALRHYVTATEQARERGDRQLELEMLVAHGTVCATPTQVNDYMNDPDLGERLCEEALALAHALDDKQAEAKIQWNLLNIYRMTERNQWARPAGERSLALAQASGLQEHEAYAANYLS